MLLGNCISSTSVGLSALLDDYTTGGTLHQLKQGTSSGCFSSVGAAATRNLCGVQPKCLADCGERPPLTEKYPQTRRQARTKSSCCCPSGATRWEAAKETIARCVRLALTPILNQVPARRTMHAAGSSGCSAVAVQHRCLKCGNIPCLAHRVCVDGAAGRHSTPTGVVTYRWDRQSVM